MQHNITSETNELDACIKEKQILHALLWEGERLDFSSIPSELLSGEKRQNSTIQ